MTLIQETGIQLITVFIAFVLGVLLDRIRLEWAQFTAPKFWRPLLRRDLTIVLGDGFPELQGFEASDVVGRGDLAGSYEITTRFAAMGRSFRRLQPVFADKMIGSDPSGTGLRKNLVVLGGKDANSLTEACLRQLNCTFELQWLDGPAIDAPKATEVSEPEQKTPQVPELQPTIYAEDGLPNFRPIMSDGLLLRDYGVIIRATNPFLPEDAKDKSVVIIYGCYGYGTLGAVLYSHEPAFLHRVQDTNEDIECVVACDVVMNTPQGFRSVYFKRHPAGTLSRARHATSISADRHD
jgi:hypothetical protein